MTKKTIILSITTLLLLSCKTTYLDKNTGEVRPTKNTVHIQKVHPKGFWTNKGYVTINHDKFKKK